MASVEHYACKYGTLLHYESDTVIGASLREYGEWAEQEMYLLSFLVSEGDVAIDVGANVGCHALALSEFVRDRGSVIAIEAQSEIFALLAASVTLSKRRNIQILHALVDRATSARFIPIKSEHATDNYGAISFATLPQGASEITQPILSIALDALGLSHCRLMKIDVEGMELDVLLGSTKLISVNRPYIYFEQTSEKNYREIVALLRSLSYRMYWHLANPFNRNNYNRSATNIFGGACETNILAIHDDLADATLARLDLARLQLAEITGWDYRPPRVTAESIAGWQSPPGPYLQACREIRQLNGTRETVCVPRCPVLRQLRVEFEALLADRKKAQEIMEHQAAQIASLNESSNGSQST